MRIDVLWTPAGVTGIDLEGRVAVVVDVLRSATTILTALEAGARCAIPAESTEEAMRIANSLGRSNVLLCGERGGVKVEGYDLGNSPMEFTADRVAEATLVVSTTNGTPAMCRAAGADLLLIGCLRNMSSVVRRVRASGLAPAFVCAARHGTVSLDDAVCAGLMVRSFLSDDGQNELSDGARAALEVAAALGRPTADFLVTTAAGKALAEIGLVEDLPYCAAADVSSAVPEMRDGGLVLPE
ncbi:MAG: 2-phosphosulfolactate phosphatase [Gemmatimonadota bacterium]